MGGGDGTGCGTRFEGLAADGQVHFDYHLRSAKCGSGERARWVPGAWVVWLFSLVDGARCEARSLGLGAGRFAGAVPGAEAADSVVRQASSAL